MRSKKRRALAPQKQARAEVRFDAIPESAKALSKQSARHRRQLRSEVKRCAVYVNGWHIVSWPPRIARIHRTRLPGGVSWRNPRPPAWPACPVSRQARRRRRTTPCLGRSTRENDARHVPRSGVL